MDLILRNARRIGAEHELTDIGIAGGRIAAVEPGLAAEGETIDLGGRLVSPGFVETHIHLDKSCILDRCKSERGDLEEAIAEAAKAKAAFTPEDVHSRAVRTLEKAILQGTTHMRTHLEVDPGVGPVVRVGGAGRTRSGDRPDRWSRLQRRGPVRWRRRARRRCRYRSVRARRRCAARS